MNKKLTRALVRTILENAQTFAWSIQGFGMLRLQLPDSGRLNIWNPAAAVRNVSTIHNHPWLFTSYIISGRFTNVQYVVRPYDAGVDDGHSSFWSSAIKTGAGGGLDGDAKRVRLQVRTTDTLFPGQHYMQQPDDVHESLPSPGAVTLNDRTYNPDPVTARVFWPFGTDWVSAEPRIATADEIDEFSILALSAWED